METMKCQVKKCNRRALILHGSMWICGDCFMKIWEANIKKKNKEVEELCQ